MLNPATLKTARRRVNFDNTEDERRARLIKYTEEVTFKEVLEEYWSKVIKYYQEEKEDLDEKSPIGDCFNLCETNDRSIYFTCLVPQMRPCWDIVLALYHLYFPEIFPSTAHVAKVLYSSLVEVNPSKIENFPYEPIMKYLMGMFDESVELEGGNFNWYLTDPVSCVWAYKRSFTLMLNGLTGMETDEEIDRLQKEAQKEQDMYDKFDVPTLVTPRYLNMVKLLAELKKETLEKGEKYRVSFTSLTPGEVLTIVKEVFPYRYPEEFKE